MEAVVRKIPGWPIASKTFRVKRDAEDWARDTEDNMVRGVFINRATTASVSQTRTASFWRACAMLRESRISALSPEIRRPSSWPVA